MKPYGYDYFMAISSTGCWRKNSHQKNEGAITSALPIRSKLSVKMNIPCENGSVWAAPIFTVPSLKHYFAPVLLGIAVECSEHLCERSNDMKIILFARQVLFLTDISSQMQQQLGQDWFLGVCE